MCAGHDSFDPAVRAASRLVRLVTKTGFNYTHLGAVFDLVFKSLNITEPSYYAVCPLFSLDRYIGQVSGRMEREELGELIN